MVGVRGFFADIAAFRDLTNKRRQRIVNASSRAPQSDRMAQLCAQLHPRAQQLQIVEVRQETPQTRTYRLQSANESPLAYFRAGQYLSVTLEIDGKGSTRPYSIASAPSDALVGFYELTVQRQSDGFGSLHIWDTWQTGHTVQTSGPAGFFHYDDLRDSPEVIAIAGGTGITPFRSWMREIASGSLQVALVLLCSHRSAESALYAPELEQLCDRHPQALRIVRTSTRAMSSKSGWQDGRWTAERIRHYAGDRDVSFFMCGPESMRRDLESQLFELGYPRRRVRSEAFGVPARGTEAAVRLDVRRNGTTARVIEARCDESVLVALERAGLAPMAECRLGQCAACRCRLIDGELDIPSVTDGRRAADAAHDVFYACSAYPKTDLTVAL